MTAFRFDELNARFIRALEKVITSYPRICGNRAEIINGQAKSGAKIRRAPMPKSKIPPMGRRQSKSL